MSSDAAKGEITNITLPKAYPFDHERCDEFFFFFFVFLFGGCRQEMGETNALKLTCRIEWHAWGVGNGGTSKTKREARA